MSEVPWFFGAEFNSLPQLLRNLKVEFSQPGGFLGSFLSTQKGTRKDYDTARNIYPATDPEPSSG